MSEQVIDFGKASEKHKHKRLNDDKDASMEAMQARFTAAFPEKKTPVKDYLKKKRAKKK